jgi:Flp pilus assembly protein TadG
MGTQRRPRGREEGQALTEFTLIASVLLVLVVAIFQLGATLSDYIDITDAARASARKAATYGADDAYVASVETNARALARTAAFESATVAGMNVTLTASPSWTAGSTVRATVTAPYRLSVMGVVVSSGNLSSSTTMRIEKRPR